LPLGLLLPLLIAPLRRWWRTLGIVLLTSFGFELMQLLFGLGVFDVDDVILNTAGGGLGFALYWLLQQLGRYINKPEKAAPEA
jgi:glycopeptide antibiotics resistance protein